MIHRILLMIMNMTNGPGLSITGPTRRSRLTTTALLATLAAALTHLVPFALAQQPGVPPAAIRGEIVLPRAGHDWMSQQVEEPCILPNPKVPGRLVMFYSAVSSSNRVVAAIGKAWAETRDPFRWHQDDANPSSDPPNAAGTPPPSASTPSSTSPRRTPTTSTTPAPPAQFRTELASRSARRAPTATPG